MSLTGTLNVREFINTRALSRNQWILVALCFLIVTVDGMDVAIMGFVAPSIIGEWGISRPAFGMVMGAAPIGLALGALLAGSSSDWIGRRKVLLGSVFIFGGMTILTAYAGNASTMALMRLLTGLGLGAAMPNSTTLLSEYVPEKRRAFLVATMFTGFNLGSAMIGFIAAALIPVQGWQSVLIFGGLVPLLMLPVLFFFLPESAKFMVVRQHDTEKVRQVLANVTRCDLQSVQHFSLGEVDTGAKQPIVVLFKQGFRMRTITLWTTYFMGLLVIYLTTSWLPTMIKDAGLPISTAANVTAMFQLGGTIGALLVGWLMDRLSPNKVISAFYLLGGLCLIALAQQGFASESLALFVFMVGFCLSGSQTGLNGYAPGCYPTFSRATGVSWMLGIGRLGSILGSSIGGVLLGMGWGFEGVFTILAIPATIAAVTIFLSPKAD
jgi:MFS transporter, AAHS family, 4-hydroxybenzoate transporter